MPPRPDRRPPHPVAGLLLLLGVTVVVGGALGSMVLGGGDAAGGTLAAIAAPPPPVVAPAVPLPVPGAEPGDVPEDPAPAPLPAAPPAGPAATGPSPVTVPAPELPPTGGTPTSQRPEPQPEPAPAPATTAPAPQPQPAPAPGTTTAPPPAPPPLKPYVSPPTAVIPAGVLPDAAGARRVLRERRAAAGAGSQESRDIGWLLELDRRFVTPDAPAGRRATIARALRANAWWFSDRRSPARRVVLRDPDGMILTYREGHGFMMNPVATTGRWRGLNDELSPEQLAEPLLQMGVRRGGGDVSLVWEYYDVAAEPDAMRPGVSGMAQARLAELLSTAYRRTGRSSFAEDAALALEGLALPVDGGGATSLVRLDGWAGTRPWYVERAYPGEDPWTGAALNGFMVTLLSLRNAGNRLSQPAVAEAAAAPTGTGTTGTAATPSPPDPVAQRAARLARQLADRGAITLRDALPAHDLGDWSLYGILTRGRPRGTYRADLNYHCYHVFLLRALARAYPDLGFSETAEKWQGYVDERGLECPAR